MLSLATRVPKFLPFDSANQHRACLVPSNDLKFPPNQHLACQMISNGTKFLSQSASWGYLMPDFCHLILPKIGTVLSWRPHVISKILPILPWGVLDLILPFDPANRHLAFLATSSDLDLNLPLKANQHSECSDLLYASQIILLKHFLLHFLLF